MTDRIDPEGRRLPIKLDTASNGEYLPLPLSPAVVLARTLAHEAATRAARRLAWSRRRFLKSACGAAATLLAMNRAQAQAGNGGGFFAIPPEAAYDLELAEAAVGGREFIFDIQGHHVNPKGGWRRWDNRWTHALRFFPQSRCGEDAIACFSAEHFIREVFLDSDTTMAVLSAVPAAPEDNPLTTEEAAVTRAAVEALEGRHRLLIHGLVHPNLAGQIDNMAVQKEKYRVAAWKTYTQWGPKGTGFRLDDPAVGIPFIEKARELGIKVICIHKGLLLFGLKPEFGDCSDIGPVAKRFPDVAFIVYHSGYETQRPEGPYNPARPASGVDVLVKSLQDHGIPPNANVYAELGSTWRLVMRDPGEAAHLLGKLFKYVGENNVLWGTDSIWYGSPQDQIQAFRTFRIAEPLREKYGYPEITPALRARVFGLNAAVPYGISPEEIKARTAGDRLALAKAAYAEDPEPAFHTYGPRNRREFLGLRRLRNGAP
jgi:predicted TIM-barrel fold metal-dependent hydrolase